MSEKTFTDELVVNLQKELLDYGVTTKQLLLYKITLNSEGQYEPKDSLLLRKNDNHTYETDILIKKRGSKIPAIVIEVKVNSLTTHDILVYSSKSVKHKDIYPSLRYGLVFGGTESLPYRFFNHNFGFDFAVAMKNSNEFKDLVEVIKTQIENHENILNEITTPHKTKTYNTKLEFKK